MTGANELPEGWVWTKLSEIANVNPSLDTSLLKDDTNVSFIPMASVEAGTGKVNASTSRLFEEVKRGYTSFQEKDVIFAKITPCMENGKSAVARSLISGVGFGSTEFHVLRPYIDINSQLLYYYIAQESFRRLARYKMTGTAGQLRVPASYLAEASFPLPPSTEQQRIVEAIEQQFSRLDEGVALLKQAQKQLKRYRAAVLKAGVEGELTAEWRAAHPAVEPANKLLERILEQRHAKWEEEQIARGKDPKKVKYEEPAGPDMSGLMGLPEGWCWTTLKQISELHRGRFSVRPRNDPRYYGGAFPFIQIGDLPEDSGKITTYKQTLNIEGCKVSREFPIGTVVVSIAASIGATGILAFPSFFPDSLVGMICSHTSMSNYISMFMRTHKQKLQTYAYASGGQSNINLPILENLIVPLPPLAEQEQIVQCIEERLSIINELESTIKKSLKRAERLRQSILHRAFTGKLVPQDPNDEPASVLLERIRQQREQVTQREKAPRIKKTNSNPKPVRVSDVPPEPIDQAALTQASLWPQASATDEEPAVLQGHYGN